MCNGFIVFVHVGNVLELFDITIGVVAKQFYKLIWMLCKPMKFRSVTGRSNQKAIQTLVFGVEQKLDYRCFAKTEHTTHLFIGLFVVKTNSIKGVMFREMIVFHKVQQK